MCAFSNCWLSGYFLSMEGFAGGGVANVISCGTRLVYAFDFTLNALGGHMGRMDGSSLRSYALKSAARTF